MELWSLNAALAPAAFVIGLAFGAVAQRTHFCTMGAITDLALFGSLRRLRAWLLAIAVALVLSQALQLTGVIDLRQSMHLGSRLAWLGPLLGGLLFGFGMVLAGGCASRNLVRLGAGSVKALAVLVVLALAALSTMAGPLAPLRLRLEAFGSIGLSAYGIEHQGLGAVLGAPIGLSVGTAQAALGLALAAALAFFCLRDAGFRTSRSDLGAGLAIGVLVPLGWLASTWLGAGAGEPAIASLTFVVPSEQSPLYSTSAAVVTIGFGLASALGVALGALVAALSSRSFRLEGLAGIGDLVRNLAGAALMGAGGVLALGCTIGQGVTGLSTLAVGSLLAVLAMAGGAVLGVRYLEAGGAVAFLRLLLARRPAGKARAPGPSR